MPGYGVTTSPVFIPRAEEVFRRSGQCPLSLRFRLCHPHTAAVNPISTYLEPSMHRIKALELTLGNLSDLVDFLSLQPPLTMIETVVIRWPNYDLRGLIFPFPGAYREIRIFKGARNLRAFTLDFYAPGCYPRITFLQYLQIPLQQLNRLDLGTMSLQIHDIHAVLLHSPQLTHCQLR